MLRLLKAIKSHKFGIIYLKFVTHLFRARLKPTFVLDSKKMFAKQIKGNYLANTLSF